MSTRRVIVGGMSQTAADLLLAADVLKAAPGHHVRPPLERARHPLAYAPDRGWYHHVYATEINLFPQLRVPSGDVRNHNAQVKPVVIHNLERKAREMLGG
jgi:hypothetical protein